MKYLEDTLAEQCLSKTLYPNTKIIVRRKKVEGTLMTYTNELEVEIDFSDVDSNLLKTSLDSNELVTENISKLENSTDESLNDNKDNFQNGNSDSNLGSDYLKERRTSRISQIFKKK
jgi:hypothetical protein